MRSPVPPLKPYAEYGAFAELLRDLIRQTGMPAKGFSDTLLRRYGENIPAKTLNNWLAGKPVGWKVTSAGYIRLLEKHLDIASDRELHTLWAALIEKSREHHRDGDGDGDGDHVNGPHAEDSEDVGEDDGEPNSSPAPPDADDVPTSDISNTDLQQGTPPAKPGPSAEVVRDPRKYRRPLSGVAVAAVVTGIFLWGLSQPWSEPLVTRLRANDVAPQSPQVSLEAVGLSQTDWATEPYDVIVKRIPVHAWASIETNDSPFALTLRCFRMASEGDLSRADALCAAASERHEGRATNYLAMRASGWRSDNSPDKEQARKLFEDAITRRSDYAIITSARWLSGHQRDAINLATLDAFIRAHIHGPCVAPLFDALVIGVRAHYGRWSGEADYGRAQSYAARLNAGDCPTIPENSVTGNPATWVAQFADMAHYEANSRSEWAQFGPPNAKNRLYVLAAPSDGAINVSGIAFNLLLSSVFDGVTKAVFIPRWKGDAETSADFEIYYGVHCLSDFRRANTLIAALADGKAVTTSVEAARAFILDQGETRSGFRDCLQSTTGREQFAKGVDPFNRRHPEGDGAILQGVFISTIGDAILRLHGAGYFDVFGEPIKIGEPSP